jgi:hypothetical protein
MGRDYAEYFIGYGVGRVGGEKHIAKMKQVRDGDRVILKRGMLEVVAVGKVVERDGRATGNSEPWRWDFDGWDLSAYCNVEWHVPPERCRPRGLNQGTIQRVNQPHLQQLAERLLAETPAQSSVSPEPVPTNRVEDPEILEFLLRQGLRTAGAEELTAAFGRIRGLAKYYYKECRWEDVREHETRTFLVLPLLLALGWPEQQIKIELAARGTKIDVACFSRPYRRDEAGNANNGDCVLILESKGFSQGLVYAPQQAKKYAEHFPACRVVVASNGYCYKAYLRGKNDLFDASPVAYVNLLNPQDRYPLDPDTVKGCLELLRLLLPSSWTR